MPDVHILNPGYLGDRTASTVSLIVGRDTLTVVDPGMVASQSVILDPMMSLGYSPDDVTDVIVSHHHPDHTMNVGLFPGVRVHDHWATYQDDKWTWRAAEGFQVDEGVMLWETPGHTPQDITTVVEQGDGVVALTHLWWNQDGPEEDPYATDMAGLREGRLRVLADATLIVPGHGESFAP